jgi:hypothetical protein
MRTIIREMGSSYTTPAEPPVTVQSATRHAGLRRPRLGCSSCTIMLYAPCFMTFSGLAVAWAFLPCAWRLCQTVAMVPDVLSRYLQSTGRPTDRFRMSVLIQNYVIGVCDARIMEVMRCTRNFLTHVTPVKRLYFRTLSEFQPSTRLT